MSYLILEAVCLQQKIPEVEGVSRHFTGLWSLVPVLKPISVGATVWDTTTLVLYSIQYMTNLSKAKEKATVNAQ